MTLYNEQIFGQLMKAYHILYQAEANVENIYNAFCCTKYLLMQQKGLAIIIILANKNSSNNIDVA